MYLDYNATAPIKEAAKHAVCDAMDRLWANSFSQHKQGRQVSIAIDSARTKIAEHLDIKPKQVRFTSGASEANTWILSHFAQRGKVLGSAVEHPSVLSHSNMTIPVETSGIVCLSTLSEILHKHASEISIVSVMGANNETGVIQPVDEISQMCRQFEIPFHCDATQLLGKVDIRPSADFLSYSAHKVGGPKGIGCVVMRRELDPLILGGPQERGTRAGTHNAPGIMGFAAAVADMRLPDIHLRGLLESGLSDLGAKILGQEAERLPNTVCALFNVPGDLLMMALDMRGIAVSTGSACSSGASKDSHVLKAMGLVGLPVRFSFGSGFNTQACQDVLKAVRDSLEAICEW